MNEDRNTIDDIYDILKEGMELVDEHEEKINRLMGGKGVVGLKEQDPLRSLEKRDDEVSIVVETAGGFSSIGVVDADGKVIIELNDKEVIADVPEDANIKGADAALNNGVLEVTIPRGED